HFKGFAAGEYTVSPSAKPFHNHGAIRRIDQYNITNLRPRNPYSPHHLKALGWAIFQICADDGNVCGIFAQPLEDLSRLSSRTDNPNRSAALLQGPHHQLTAHAA